MSGTDLYSILSRIAPPELAGTHLGWRVWYDWGHFEHGICYRETKWRGQSPSGELIEHPDGVGSWLWLKGEIERRSNR